MLGHAETVLGAADTVLDVGDAGDSPAAAAGGGGAAPPSGDGRKGSLRAIVAGDAGAEVGGVGPPKTTSSNELMLRVGEGAARKERGAGGRA